VEGGGCCGARERKRESIRRSKISTHLWCSGQTIRDQAAMGSLAERTTQGSRTGQGDDKEKQRSQKTTKERLGVMVTLDRKKMNQINKDRKRKGGGYHGKKVRWRGTERGKRLEEGQLYGAGATKGGKSREKKHRGGKTHRG